MRILILLLLLCLLSSAWSDIQFEEVSQHAGITRLGQSWGNAWGDFDGDGYLDLWATNHKQKPSLYRNNGDGTFTDIIDIVWNANPYADTHGVAWADFDNDGDQDLMVVSGGGGGTNPSNPKHNNHFYVNENGMLVERAAELRVNFPLLRGRAPLWLDSNNDGKLDLILTGRARPDRTGALVATSLFEQTESGFETVNNFSGFQLEKDASLAQLSDITGDGVLDVVLNVSPYPGKIYDLSVIPFRELSTTLSIPKRYNVQDVAFADFNGDLHPDIFLARAIYRSYIDTQNPQAITFNIQTNMGTPHPFECCPDNRITFNIQTNMGEKGVSFKTEGQVRFELYTVWATRLRHLKIGAAGLRLTAFDGEFIQTDPTRNISFFAADLSPDDPRVIGTAPRPKNELYGMYIGYDPDTERWTLLYHTMPAIQTNWSGFEGTIESTQPITDIIPINFSVSDLLSNPQSMLLTNTATGEQRGYVPTPSTSNTFLDGRSVVAGDFDNDMDIDLYIVRSTSAGNLPNHLYENLGNNGFRQVPGAGGAEASPLGKGQSATMADYDRDGYLDIFVTNGKGGAPFNEGPDQLFRNSSSGNNWLQIDLQGTLSNRDGIGARLFATTPDGKTQLRENGGGIHWAQQDQKRIHFGLAENEKVSELTIHWPSGITQKLQDIPVNQVIRVVESDVRDTLLGDLNEDGVVDISDLILIAKHIGESPPTDPRADANGDNTVDINDIIWIIKTIEASIITAAPTNRMTSQEDIDALSALYEKIEDISVNFAQIELVKRFLRQFLMPAEQPLATKLYANYPNPFNPETWIPYQLAEDTEITIRIYNASGQVVRTIFTGNQAAGYYLNRSKAAYWDGKNELGEQVASGVYIYELKTPTFKQTKRLVVLK